MAPVNLGTAVVPGNDADFFRAPAGVAILAGQVVYEGSDGRLALASTGADLAGKRFGIATNSAPTAGQEVNVQFAGTLTGTATLVKGAIYVASDTAGSVANLEGGTPDIGANDWINVVCIAITTASVKVRCWAPSVQHA